MRSSYRQPSLGEGFVSEIAVDRVLSQTTYLRRSLPALFHTAFPIQPPPLRGTSFHRKEGMTTRAPSLGRGCRAQRGGVGFLFLRRSRLLFVFPMGKGFVRRYCFSTYACIRSDNARKAIFSFRKPSPLGKGGPRQRWIGCSRKRRT